MVQVFVVINQDCGTWGWETNLSWREKSINPYVGRGMGKEFPTAKSHAISRDVGIKLDTQKEKVKISNKKKV